jgi:putative ABC transport system permease protein
LASGFGRWSIQIEGELVESIGEAPVTHLQKISPDWMEVLGLTLEEGRGLQDTDIGGRPLVGVVNEAFARRVLRGGKAVGRRIRTFGTDAPWIEIVGVVGDVKHEGLQVEPYQMLYVPFAQSVDNSIDVSHNMGLFVETQTDPAVLAGPIRELAKRIEASVAITSSQTMKDVRAEAASDREFPTVLLGVFGAVALILSAIGIYAMVSYSVNQRTREVGVRMAVGAEGRDVQWMVVRQAGVPVAAGVALGLLGAIHATDYIESLLFNVSPTDPLSYGSVAVVLAAVAFLAAYLPARRASKVDPMAVLRSE